MSSAGETAATVAYQARGVGDSVASYARQHPLQVALTVGALTWWMMRGRGDSEEWYGSADTSWDESEGRSYRDGRSLTNRVGEYASSARDTVGEYASSARDTVGEYASTYGFVMNGGTSENALSVYEAQAKQLRIITGVRGSREGCLPTFLCAADSSADLAPGEFGASSQDRPQCSGG